MRINEGGSSARIELDFNTRNEIFPKKGRVQRRPNESGENGGIRAAIAPSQQSQALVVDHEGR
jgi:hypothetical protein